MTVESLLKDNELTSTINNLVRESGRSFPSKGIEGEASLASENKQQNVKTPISSVFNGVQPKDVLPVHS